MQKTHTFLNETMQCLLMRYPCLFCSPPAASRPFFLFSLLLAVLALSAGCASDPKTAIANSSSQGPFELLHQKIYGSEFSGAVLGESNYIPRESLGFEIQAIGLERSSCYGNCPQYTFLVHNDGTAFFCGRAYSQRRGLYRGRASLDLFNALANAIVDVGFFDLPSSSLTLSTDLESTFLYVRIPRESKVVRDYGASGPARLWLLEEVLESVALSISWQLTDEQSDCTSILEAVETR